MSIRSLIVNRPDAGRPLLDWLQARLALSRPAVLRLIRERRVYLGGKPCTNPRQHLKPGQRVEVRVAFDNRRAGNAGPTTRPKHGAPAPGPRKPPAAGLPTPVIRY